MSSSNLLACSHVFLKAPTCFLPQKNIPGLSCIFPASSIGEWYLEIKNLVVGVLVATGVSLFLDLLRG